MYICIYVYMYIYIYYIYMHTYMLKTPRATSSKCCVCSPRADHGRPHWLCSENLSARHPSHDHDHTSPSRAPALPFIGHSRKIQPTVEGGAPFFLFPSSCIAVHKSKSSIRSRIYVYICAYVQYIYIILYILCIYSYNIHTYTLSLSLSLSLSLYTSRETLKMRCRLAV